MNIKLPGDCIRSYVFKRSLVEKRGICCHEHKVRGKDLSRAGKFREIVSVYIVRVAQHTRHAQPELLESPETNFASSQLALAFIDVIGYWHDNHDEFFGESCIQFKQNVCRRLENQLQTLQTLEARRESREFGWLPQADSLNYFSQDLRSTRTAIRQPTSRKRSSSRSFDQSVCAPPRSSEIRYTHTFQYRCKSCRGRERASSAVRQARCI